MNKNGEIHVPVEEKAKQLKTVSHSNLPEKAIKPETPEQFAKLKHWFKVLRQICQERPEIVLKALSKLEKSTDPWSWDGFYTDTLIKAEPLAWELGGKKRAEKQFLEYDLDPVKTMQVVEFLRSNVSKKEIFKKKKAEKIISKHYIQRFYQYKEQDLEIIKEFINSCDNPVHLLKEIETIMDYSHIGNQYLKQFLIYGKSLANNAKALEIITQLKKFDNLEKLDAGSLSSLKDENSENHYFFHNVLDPIQSFSQLDEDIYQELFSQENIDHAQQLWKRLTKKPLQIAALYDLLMLAHNPKIELAFVVNLSFHLNEIEGSLFKSPVQLKREINKIEMVYKLFPEIWELYKEGFNVDNYLNLSLFDDQNNLLNEIEKIIAEKEKFLTVINNKQIRKNAQILKKYGLRMFLPNDEKSSPKVSLDYLINSDPACLEKSLIIADTGLYGDLIDSFYRQNNLFKDVWRQTKNWLSAFSVEEINEAFLPIKKENNINLKPDLSLIVNNLDSIEDLKKRVAAIVNPDIRNLVEDEEFLNKVAFYEQRGSPDKQIWAHILKKPDLYIDLYRNQKIFTKKLDILLENKFDLQGLLYPEGLSLLNDMTEEELTQASQALLTEDNSLGKYLAVDNLKKARLLSKLDQTELTQIETDFQSNSTFFNNFYSETWYNDQYLKAEDLELYLSFDQEQRERVWQLLNSLNERYDFRRGKEIFEKDVLHDLGFLCRLSNNEIHQQRFQLFLDLLNNEQENININDLKISANQRIFEKILNFLENNSELTINDYFDEEGVATVRLLNDLSKIQDKETNFYEITELLNEKSLAKMDSIQRIFWQFWQKQNHGHIKRSLLEKKDQFDALSRDKLTANQWLLEVSQSAKDSFEVNTVGENQKNVSKTRLSLVEEQEFKKKILELVVKKNLVSPKFYTVCSVLRHNLDENSYLIESFAPAFKEAFGFDLSEDFVKKYDRFFQKSQGEDFAALITDHLSYWKNNSDLLRKLELIGWEVNNFDKFRSLVQNPEINTVLGNTDKELLISLSRDIGLSPNNIYYANKSSLEWLEQNLDSTERKTFFKKILNEKPSSFNSCVAAFRSIDKKTINQIITEPLYTERLLDAMREFNNITPSLITVYILNPSEGARSEYREKITKFKEGVHINVPIMSLAKGSGGIDFLTDMIALTFPGTNFTEIKRELSQLQDRCQDLANLNIREQGYQGQIVSKEKIVQLKDINKPIDDGVVNLIKVIFADQQEKEYLALGGDDKLAFQGWARLLVEAGATNQQTLFKDNLTEVIACSRVSLGDKITLFAEKMGGDTSQIPAKNEVLSKAKELFGIYYKDNAPEAIELFLQKHQTEADILLNRLSVKRLNNLEKNIAGAKTIDEESRANFKEIIEELRNSGLAEAERRQLLARLLAFMTDRSIFAGTTGLRRKVSKEAGKIVLRDKEGQDIDPNLIISGHVTKNAASYFAKNTAGVCTAGDKELFNRPDHFHVNLVNTGGIVVGNIQAYQTTCNGQSALIFRGFNPSTSIVSATNAEILCDQMVDIVKQIAADNDITQILIPEQDFWHPLTNRVGEGIDKYFAQRFYRPENKVKLSFNITNRKTVDSFYRIT